MRSPKSPYRVEIGYVKPLEGLGSASSYTGETIDQVLAYASNEVAANRTAAYIKVMHNEDTYPKFNWVVVGTSKMDANGNLEQPLATNNEPRHVIGRRVAQLRNEAGMTQAKLAELTGMRQAHIARIEAGRYSVGIDILAKIANALDCTVDIIKNPPK